MSSSGVGSRDLRDGVIDDADLERSRAGSGADGPVWVRALCKSRGNGRANGGGSPICAFGSAIGPVGRPTGRIDSPNGPLGIATVPVGRPINALGNPMRWLGIPTGPLGSLNCPLGCAIGDIDSPIGPLGSSIDPLGIPIGPLCSPTGPPGSGVGGVGSAIGADRVSVRQPAMAGGLQQAVLVGSLFNPPALR